MTNSDSGRAIASLVLSILGLIGFLPVLGSILGILLGQGEQGGTAQAGVVLGWIGLALCSLVVMAFIAMALLGVGFFALAG